MKMTGSCERSGFSTGRRFAAAVAVSALAATALAGCGSAVRDKPQALAGTAMAAKVTHQGSIVWGKCPPPADGSSLNPQLNCGTLAVPLNYQDPAGAKIQVAVSRLSTAKPGKRHGVLLLNPGGPALGGLDMPATMAPTLPKSVLDSYDLIGFDPRGVEHSTPQSCGLTDPTVAGLFPYPAANGSITKNVALARADAAQCARGAGENLKYYTTADTARDMDRIRQALGETKISYWGQSYGTYLGAVYRSLFPDRTDRMVLEGQRRPRQGVGR